jgi:hypothetical protein
MENESYLEACLQQTHLHLRQNDTKDAEHKKQQHV